MRKDEREAGGERKRDAPPPRPRPPRPLPPQEAEYGMCWNGAN